MSKRPHLILSPTTVSRIPIESDEERQLREVKFASDAALLSPQLSREEAEALLAFPYETPRASSSYLPLCILKRLHELGLIEALHGGFPHSSRKIVTMYRCTDLGIYVAGEFARKGWFGPEWKKKWKRAGVRTLLDR